MEARERIGRTLVIELTTYRRSSVSGRWTTTYRRCQSWREVLAVLAVRPGRVRVSAVDGLVSVDVGL